MAIAADSYQTLPSASIEDPQAVIERVLRQFGPKQTRPKMDADELKAILRPRIDEAIAFVDGTLSPYRVQAYNYYHGGTFGDEDAARSQLVLSELRDTVQQVLPALMRLFFGAEQVVSYAANTPEAVELADQASAYAEHIVKVDNDGVLLFYTAFKEALITKFAVLKLYYLAESRHVTQTYTGIEENLILLMSQEGTAVKVINHYMTEAGPLFDVEVETTHQEPGFRLQLLAPEEFLITPQAAHPDQAALVAHRRHLSRSELLSLGYAATVVEGLKTASSPDIASPERLSRQAGLGTDQQDTDADESLEPVLYIEAYAKVDGDGDGIAELRRVCLGGEDYEILANEPCEEAPFILLVPDPEPHTFLGSSFYDLLKEVQYGKSVIARCILDSLGSSIVPRLKYVKGKVDLEALLANSPRKPVECVDNVADMEWYNMPFAAREAIPMLEFFDTVRKDRTGVNDISAGLSANVFVNTTKAAVDATTLSAQARTEMIARILAETAFKPLYRLLLRLMCKHQDKPRVLKLRGQWVTVDPRTYDPNMTTHVNVALGTGSLEVKQASLSAILAIQEKILEATGYQQNPLVSYQNYYSTLVKLVNLAGWQNADDFFSDPSQGQPQGAAPTGAAQTDNSAAIAQAGIEAQKIKSQTDMAINQAKLQTSGQLDQQKLDLERKKEMVEAMLKMAELAAKGVPLDPTLAATIMQTLGGPGGGG